MHKWLQRWRKSGDQGQALVELALILPILILFLLGTIEFGRIMGTSMLLSHASRESSRIAAVGGTNLAVTNYISSINGLVDPSRITVTINPSGTRVRGQIVTVKLNYSVPLYAPVINTMVTNPFPIEAETSMRIE